MLLISALPIYMGIPAPVPLIAWLVFISNYEWQKCLTLWAPISQNGQNLPTNCLSVFDYFVVLVLKGLMLIWLPSSDFSIITELISGYFGADLKRS